MARGFIESGCEIPKDANPIEMMLNKKLLRRKERLEEELRTLNEAIELFNRNPDMEKAINLLGRINL